MNKLGKSFFKSLLLAVLFYSSLAAAESVWKGVSTGGNMVTITGDQVCVDSMKPGVGYATRPRPYGLSQDYTVSFDFKLDTNNNHWFILYFDEFAYVAMDWGTDLKHFQPGMPYSVSSLMGKLEPGKWYRIKIDARPSQKSFDVFVDGAKLGTATNVEPGKRVPGTPSLQDVPEGGILIGDQETTDYNRGAGCWKNFSFPTGESSGWKSITTGGNAVNISGDQVCIDSMKPGVGYATRTRPYGLSQDYTVSFDFKLDTSNNHWFILYFDEFAYVGIDWGTDLKHWQPGMAYNLSNLLSKLDPGKWYRIKIDAHPSQKSFDVLVDGQKLGTAVNVEPGKRVVPGMPSLQDVAEGGILIGDQETTDYNRGAGCWKNFSFSAVPTPTPVHTPADTGADQGRGQGKATIYTSEQLNLKDVDVYQYDYLNWNNTNWGGNQSEYVSSNVDGKGNTRRRIYIWFDVNSIPGGADNWNKVELELSLGHAAIAGNLKVNAFRVTGAWIEGDGIYLANQNAPNAGAGVISWNFQPQWDSGKAWASAVAGDKGGPVRWDITELIKGWRSGQFPNQGLVLVGEGEGSASFSKGFVSSESPNAELRPKVVVTTK